MVESNSLRALRGSATQGLGQVWVLSSFAGGAAALRWLKLPEYVFTRPADFGLRVGHEG